MENRNPKMVEIRGKNNISFKCRVCGSVWYKPPLSKKFGWKCPNGCNLKDLEQKRYEEVIRSES